MRITTEIAPDDHRDFIQSLAGGRTEETMALEGDRDLSKARFRMIISVLACFGIIAWTGYQLGVERLLDHWFFSSVVFIVLILSAISFFWFTGVRHVRKDLAKIADGDLIDRTTMREGINIGTANYSLDEENFTAEFALVKKIYPLSVFRQLRQAPTAYYLMIDEGSGFIVPKRSFGDVSRRKEFENHVAACVGIGR